MPGRLHKHQLLRRGLLSEAAFVTPQCQQQQQQQQHRCVSSECF